jgi:hypothetical protein
MFLLPKKVSPLNLLEDFITPIWAKEELSNMSVPIKRAQDTVFVESILVSSCLMNTFPAQLVVLGAT